MTNLIATIVVCVVTNVASTDNAAYRQHPYIMWPEGGGPEVVDTPATEKTETTEVVEIKTLKFEWEGKPWTAEHRTVLSRTVKRSVKRETWEEAE